MPLQQIAQYYDGYRMMNGSDTGWGVGMMLVGLLFTVVLIVGIIHLLKGGVAPHHVQHERPIDIAKTRYAKGELTKTQFEQIKKDLRDE